jgi:hypothetical protein
MKNILLISLLLTLYTGYSFAQCGANQVEVKVDILTDPWGEETYWTLSDLQGTIVLQGGQGGVYLDNTSYSDSICVSSSSCLVFEIYDTWGDGIFTPAACELYVDGLLVYSGSNNIGSYASTLVNCSDSCVLVLDALNDLHDHINATITLTPVELTSIKNIFTLFPGCLAISESNILLSKSVVADYDSLFGALFTTPGTQNGFSKDPAIAPGMELERAMIALQQGIFDEVFTSGVYGNYPQHLNGWKYGACTTFPGFVAPPADSTIGVSVPIRANFEDPDGMNPYYEINGDGTDHALRPTGLYLSPGSVATVTVPDSLVGQDYWIKVGSHDWDLTNREMFLRFDRISKKFLINSNTIEVFNPLGGAISILVPYGADDGIVQVTVNNGVEAPFFSLKSFYETTDFNAELSKPGPWAVFETDNVMFTIPKHSIVPGQYNLMQAMQDWESALRGMNSILARQIIPDKHNMYMIADVDIRAGVYSIGYPMSNTTLNYTNVPGPVYFLNGPGLDDDINFHELGHALALSQFSGEEEALVNFPYVMALNYGLGVDLNEAVANSLGTSTIDIDNAAIHRLISSTFGSERNISDSEMNEVRYQHRGFGHYFEIVNILGWCPLRNFWKQEAIDFENGINYGSNDDKRIVRMSVAAQADLRPLFHVFGIIAQDPVALQDTLNQLGIQPSLAIYNRLQDYLDLIPQDNAEFVNSAIDVYPDLYTAGPTGNPNYGVGWFYLKSLSYNTAEAQIITNTLQSIINLYYPNGQPAGGNTNLCCLLDPLQLNMVNQEVVVTGGVEPYQISIDTTGNVMTVTVVDFDGCGSTDQFTITGFTEENPQGINIYPNPASTEIYIDLKRNNEQIENLRIVSFQGQVLNQSRRTDRVNVSALREGVYLLQIELAGGEQISKKVLILR